MHGIYRPVSIALLLIGFLSAQTIKPGFQFQANVKPGDSVPIDGTGLDKEVSVTLQAAGKPALPPIQVTATATGISFKLPVDAAGQYTVTATPPIANIPPLTVTPAATPPAAAPDSAKLPSIDSVFPTTTYPVRERFSFDINGQNFDPKPENDSVEVLDQGRIQFNTRFTAGLAAAPGSAGGQVTQCSQVTDESRLPCLEVSSDGRQLMVYGYPRRHAYQGAMQVRVVTTVGASAPSGLFTLSRVSYRVVLAASIAIFALLMYIVYRLVVKGMQNYTVAGRTYSPLYAFLIDKTTDTYSLSKFQLFAFSLVLFFGYVYVFLCRTLVQWTFSLPDVPNNYPSLLAISAGTTAAAAGLNASRGGNGGGPVHPSAADFISNGGLVVADRFQFFVWTLIGCLGFVALIVMQDPAKVSEFPDFPSGLLYVMGVSAAGYLGGKAVRNPGPILKTITPKINATTATNLDLTIDGSNLDKDAKFRVDGAPQTTVGQVTWSQAPGEPSGYSDGLTITLLQAASFFSGDHMLEITNGDGIGAQGIFTGTPMKITAANPSSIPVNTTTPVILDVTDFRPNSSARWLAPGSSSPVEIPASGVGKPTPIATPVPLPDPAPRPAVQVKIDVAAGTLAGPGTLTLVTPLGNTEAFTLTVTSAK